MRLIFLWNWLLCTISYKKTQGQIDFRCAKPAKINAIFYPFQTTVGLRKWSGANLQPINANPPLAEEISSWDQWFLVPWFGVPVCVDLKEPAFQRAFFLLKNEWYDDILGLAPQNCRPSVAQVDLESLVLCCAVYRSLHSCVAQSKQMVSPARFCLM